jgi:hypothetical protein
VVSGRPSAFSFLRSSINYCGGLVLFFEFDDHDLEGIFARIHIGMLRTSRIGGKPIGMAGLPCVIFSRAVLFDDLYGATLERGDGGAVAF